MQTSAAYRHTGLIAKHSKVNATASHAVLLLSAGWQSPAPSPPHSPMAPKSPSFRQLQHMSSPIAERFRRAAVDSDVIVEPGSRVLQQQDSAADGAAAAAAAAANCAADMATTVIDASGAQRLVIEGSESHAAVPAAGSIDGGHSQRSIGAPDIVEERSSMSVSSSVQEGRVLPMEQSQQAQPRKLWSVDAAAPPVRRTVSSSRPSSRPGSAGTNGRQQPSSRRASAQEQQQGSVGKESSQGAVSGSVPSYAAGTRSSTARGASGAVAGARGTARQADCPAPSSKSRPASRPQTAGEAAYHSRGRRCQAPDIATSQRAVPHATLRPKSSARGR